MFNYIYDVFHFILFYFILFSEIINVVIDSKIFLWIIAPISDAAAVISNVIKTLLVDGVSTSFINGPRKLLINPPSWFTVFSVVPFLWNSTIFWRLNNFYNIFYFIFCQR